MIIEYSEKYKEDCKDLLVELEEYICGIDEDHLDHVHSEYREKMFDVKWKEVQEKNGKVYLAIENNHAVGLIMGCIREYEEYDYLDYTCPKEGEVTELIISKSFRGKGIGKELMKKMEKYFHELDCKYILVDAFSYNKNAIEFYGKEGYHSRMNTMIKRIDES